MHSTLGPSSRELARVTCADGNYLSSNTVSRVATAGIGLLRRRVPFIDRQLARDECQALIRKIVAPQGGASTSNAEALGQKKGRDSFTVQQFHDFGLA